MKIKRTTSNDLEKYYSGHYPEQHSKSFSRRSDTLILDIMANGGVVTFKSYNSQSI